MSVNALLEVNELAKYFPVHGGVLSRVVDHVKAVDNVSFEINEGEVFGLVGESGCGKSTTGRTLLRLLEPTRGSVKFEGVDIFSLPKEKMRKLRKNMQIIFQDPYASLNPRMTIGATLTEPYTIHNVGEKKERPEMAARLLEKVGLSSDAMSRYPHEFSGGQRQRIGLARALSLKPKLIVCDEPVSALDVSIQAQIVNLLLDLKKEFGMAYLFISHDLSVVEKMCDRVAVMYLGKIMEIGPAKAIYENPIHPYTEALLSATPTVVPGKSGKRIVLEGEVPSPINPPSGCVFRTRCFMAKKECAEKVPELSDRGDGRKAACIVR